MISKKQLLLPFIIAPVFMVMASDNPHNSQTLEQTYHELGTHSLLRDIFLKFPFVGETRYYSQYNAGEQQSNAENVWTMLRSDLSSGYRWTERSTIDHSDAVKKQKLLGKAKGLVTITDVAPSDIDNPDAGYPIPVIIHTDTTLKSVDSGTEATQTIQFKPDEIIGVTYNGFTLTRKEKWTDKLDSHTVHETLKSTDFSYDDDEGFTFSVSPFELSTTQSGKQNQNWQVDIGKLKIASVVEKIPFDVRLKHANFSHTNDALAPADKDDFKQLGTSKVTIEGLDFYLDGIDAIKITSLKNTQTIEKSGDAYSLDATLEVTTDSDIVGLLTGRVGMLINKATLTLHIDKVSATTLNLFTSLQAEKTPRRLRRALEDLMENFTHSFVFDGATLKATLVLNTDIGDANVMLKLIRNPDTDQSSLDALMKSGDYYALSNAIENALQVKIEATADPRISTVLGISDLLLRASLKPKIVDGKEVFNLSLSKKKKTFNDEIIEERR
ncbi:MAG: hypothetical protein KGV50_03215 [Gammaproteobacteria bacterium]|nr:hypothetical protein [Gammaproteobacteria bacterium]